MNKHIPLVAFLLVLVQLACAMPSVPVSQPTQEIQATLPPEPAFTKEPDPVMSVTPTAATQSAPADPAQRVVLGSPFSADCGGGIPLIWRNDSFNDQMPYDYASAMDDHHGYVTLYPPGGCDVAKTEGEVIAPADGELNQFAEYGLALSLPEKIYPAGMEDVMKFAGIQDADLARVANIQLQFGKYLASNGTTGPVQKGQKIGNIVPTGGDQPQLEYQVTFTYDDGKDVITYIVSPTLFKYDGETWPCVEGSPYDCEPKAGDYK
jgi:hypothetical protein